MFSTTETGPGKLYKIPLKLEEKEKVLVQIKQCHEVILKLCDDMDEFEKMIMGHCGNSKIILENFKSKDFKDVATGKIDVAKLAGMFMN